MSAKITVREFRRCCPYSIRVLGGDDVVVSPPYDQGRHLDVVELLEDVVPDEPLDGRQEPRPPGAIVELLEQQLGSQLLGVLAEPLEARLAESGPPHPALLQAHQKRGRSGRHPGGGLGRLGAEAGRCVTPAAETSTSFSNRSGWATAASAEMKPPIELPTNAHLPIPTASQNR